MEQQSLNQHLGLSHNQSVETFLSSMVNTAPHGALQDHPACPPEAPGENLELTTLLIMKDVQDHPGKPPPPNKPHSQTLMELWSPELL